MKFMLPTLTAACVCCSTLATAAVQDESWIERSPYYEEDAWWDVTE